MDSVFRDVLSSSDMFTAQSKIVIALSLRDMHSVFETKAHSIRCGSRKELMNDRYLPRCPWVPNSVFDGQQMDSGQTAILVTTDAKVYSDYVGSCPSKRLPPINYFGERNMLRRMPKVTSKTVTSVMHASDKSPVTHRKACDDRAKNKEIRKKKSVSWKDDAPNGCLTQESTSSYISQPARIVHKIKCFVLGREDL